MAITKEIKKEDNNYKVELKECYLKIDEILFDILLEEDEIELGIRGYSDKDARADDKALGILKKREMLSLTKFLEIAKNNNIKLESKSDFIKTAYLYVKTLDFFKDGIDT